MVHLESIRGRLRLMLSSAPSHKIFILGTGRSGTHWIGHILEAHPDVRATVEQEPMWGWVKRMAVDPSSRPKLYPKLARRYRRQHHLSAPGHYLDKSHPNIWIAERLAASFDDARFVGIIRNPYATVASMLRHMGVQGWHDRWREFPVPNDFLGIAEADVVSYEGLPLATKCAMRWASHRDRMGVLERVLGERLMVVQYEQLMTETRPLLDELAAFLSLTSPLPMPEIREASLDKWKDQLTEAEVEQIQRVVEAAPPSGSHRAHT